jgi:hypothetical protein
MHGDFLGIGRCRAGHQDLPFQKALLEFRGLLVGARSALRRQFDFEHLYELRELLTSEDKAVRGE